MYLPLFGLFSRENTLLHREFSAAQDLYISIHTPGILYTSGSCALIVHTKSTVTRPLAVVAAGEVYR